MAPHGAGAASAIPLKLDNGAVIAATGGPGLPVLEGVCKAFTHSGLQYPDGALVLGVASDSGPVSIMDTPVAKLRFRRYLACARCKLWWMTPEWGTSTGTLPPETQFLLLELEEGGPYAIVLPLIDGDFRATLRRSKNGQKDSQELWLRMESGDEVTMGQRWDRALYLAAGQNPFELVDRGVAAAAQLSGTAKPRAEKRIPDSVNYFGWCTWDAFYSTVSAKGLQEGLVTLNEGGIPAKLLIIDDGWQMTDVDPPFRSAPMSQMVEDLSVTDLPPQAAAAKDLARELAASTEIDFYKESGKVMAETARFTPQGTSAGNVMPTLQGVGPSAALPPHHSSLGSLSSAGSVQSGDGGAALDRAAASAEIQPLITDPKMKEEATLVVRAAQKMTGWLMGLATASFLIFYQWVVEPAAPDSLSVRLFARAAQGFLRPAMLSFYATASDFTRRLTSVKANGKFSHIDAGPEEDWEMQEERLGDVVKELKRRHGLKYVYCWHGLPAYWAGVAPDAPSMSGYNSRVLYAKPTPGVLEIEPSMAWNPAVLAGVGVPENPSELYTAMHEYLQGAGVDGVKVDCQAGVGLVGGAMGGGPSLSRRMHAALEASVRQHFPDNHCINCMCHSTENLYRMANTGVARASDDFYPRDLVSSSPHIGACGYNSVFIGALAQPDWDMFHSKHPAARLHAMARAVSGGAVYVSDKPGEHDFQLLRQLVLPDGTILRAQLPGRPTRDCLFADVLRDNASLLKLWNINSVVGIVGVFNLQGSAWDRQRRKFHTHNRRPPTLETQVRPTDVETFADACTPAAGSTFACYSYTDRTLKLLQPAEPVTVHCPPGHSDLLWVSPVQQVGGVSIAPLGLPAMINGAGAVLNCSLNAVSAGNGTNGGSSGGGAVASFDVRGAGEFMMYSSCRPARVLAGSTLIEFGYEAESSKLSVVLPQQQDLRCRIEVLYN